MERFDYQAVWDLKWQLFETWSEALFSLFDTCHWCLDTLSLNETCHLNELIGEEKPFDLVCAT
jgi:hypothetical protein